MLQLPEVVVLRTEVDARIRRARRTLVVGDFQPRVQRHRVLDLERQLARAGLQAGADDRINLPVAAGVGRVELALEDVRVQQHIRVQTRQRAQDIGRAEPVVPLHVDRREPALGHLDGHHGVGELLRRQRHGHRHIPALAIRHLQLAQRGADVGERDIGAERVRHVREDVAEARRRQHRVAGDEIFFHLEPRPGVGRSILFLDGGHGSNGHDGIGRERRGRRHGLFRRCVAQLGQLLLHGRARLRLRRRVRRLRAQVRREQHRHQQQPRHERRAGALEIIFRLRRQILLPPLARRDAKTLFEHRVEQPQMPVAAFVGDVDDLGVGVSEELARALEAQLGLALAQRHAELGAKQPAEMPLAAMQPLGQLRQRARRQFRVRHLRDELAKPLVQFVARVFHRRHRQHAGHRLRPELQQRRAHGQVFPAGLDDEARKFLPHRLGGGEENGVRGKIFAGQLQLMAFRDRDQAVEEFRLDTEKFQLERAELARAQHQMGGGRGDKAVAGRQLPRAAALQPVAHALGHAHHRPPGHRRRPFARGAEGDLLQDEMSFDGHQSAENAGIVCLSGFGFVTIGQLPRPPPGRKLMAGVFRPAGETRFTQSPQPFNPNVAGQFGRRA